MDRAILRKWCWCANHRVTIGNSGVLWSTHMIMAPIVMWPNLIGYDMIPEWLDHEGRVSIFQKSKPQVSKQMQTCGKGKAFWKTPQTVSWNSRFCTDNVCILKFSSASILNILRIAELVSLVKTPRVKRLQYHLTSLVFKTSHSRISECEFVHNAGKYFFVQGHVLRKTGQEGPFKYTETHGTGYGQP